jgi:hypothetical protein
MRIRRILGRGGIAIALGVAAMGAAALSGPVAGHHPVTVRADVVANDLGPDNFQAKH